VRFTIPEGTPIWEVASIVADSLDLDSAAFVALNQDSAFLEQTGLPCVEGYLFPETYVFPWGVTEIDVAKVMVQQFRDKTDTIWPDSLPLNLSPHDIVTLASIIEVETKLDDERPLVASVYYNRLRRNWRLDADPTVIYGLGGLDRPLYRNDLRKDTPYNTYVYGGLPPTPINSPGLAAIAAAINPVESDFYFFVANDSGGHIFSRTNAEHNRARNRLKALKRRQSR
ncbi:MAG: endolytic transglycosylase MltG, partial [Candidatus Zixiibacteriota bacterium]